MADNGKLILVEKGQDEQEFALPKGIATIGRAEINDIVLGDSRVSRAHARLECDESGCILVDLGSVNGTRVNSKRTSRIKLSSGDIIQLGDSLLRFETSALRPEPAVTQIASVAELEQTLASETLPTNIGSTREPRMVIHGPGKTWDVLLAQEMSTIGRDPDSTIPLDDPETSRHHARIERRGHHFILKDLGSTNGTWLGHERLDEHVFQDGDVLRIGHVRLMYKKGFAPEELTVVEPPMSGRGRKRPVIIIPGIMGSELWRGNERLWPNLKQVFTHPECISLPDLTPQDARAVVNEIIIVPNMVKLAQYKRLGNYIEEELGYERGKNLLEFAYDWRHDNRISARQLAQTVEDWQKKTKDNQPITIVAHSMGSLVSRYYVERLGGKAKVDRLIFLGGPHYGAPKIITTLLRGPDLLPFGILGEKLRQMVSTFPSVYQLLPSYLCAVDQDGRHINVLIDESWLPEAQRPLLRIAKEFRQELGTRCSVPCISIFGYGLKTVTGASVRTESGGAWQKINFNIEHNGDGTVPEVSAVLEGSEIHPVMQYHGSLYTDNDVMMRLKVELTRPLV